MTAKLRKPWSKADVLPCAEIYQDDGVDPRVFFRKKENRSNDRKIRQLCHQVKQTLEILWSEVEATMGWEITEVLPAPHASRLQVTVVTEGTHPSEEALAALRDAIEENRTLWREALGQTIHRKRVPELVFQVMVYNAPQKIENREAE